MPRSQRTQLKKTAVTEVPLGQLTSGVTQRVNMPIVQPQKTAGQALLEGVGVAMKAGAEIIQEQNDAKLESESKITDTFNRVQGSLYGTNRARERYDEIIKNSKGPEDTLKLIGEAGISFFEDLKTGDYAKNSVFIEKSVSSFTTRLDSLYKKATKEVDANIQKNAKFAISTSTTASLAEKEPALDILSTIDRYKEWEGSNAERLMVYTTSALSFAEEELRRQLEDPEHDFDLEAFKNNYLEIKTAKGVSLLQNPATGDKIRQFYNKMSGEVSKAFTKAKEGYKEQTRALEASSETTPIDFSKHLKEGARLGFYEDTINNPEVSNLQASFDKDYVKGIIDTITIGLNEEEKSAAALLKGDDVYVKGDARRVLEDYRDTLQAQVDKGLLNPEVAAKSLNEMIDRVNTQQQHHTYLGSFSLDNPNNDKDYKTFTNPETKKEVKARVLTALSATEGRIASATTVVQKQKALSAFVSIVNNNTAVSQPAVNARMPFTTEIDKVQEGLSFLEDLRSIPNGTDVINTMSTRNRNFYTALNALTELEGIPQVTEAVVNRVTTLMLSTDASRDYGVTLKEKYSNQKNLLLSMEQMPQGVQSKLLMMYDYLTDLSTPSEASLYIEKVVAPEYRKETVREGSKTLGIPLTGDALEYINFGARPAEQKGFGTTSILNAFTAANKGVAGDVRLTYDEVGDVYTLGSKLDDLSAASFTNLEKFKMTFSELKPYLGAQ